MIAALAGSVMAEAELLNPLNGGPHARFLAFRDKRAAAWQQSLLDCDVVTDVRGDVLRVGLGLYHDADDVTAFARHAATLS